MSGLPLLAALGVLAAAAIPACEWVWALTTRARAIDPTAAADSSVLGAPKVVMRTCLGLSCLFALTTVGAIWINRQGTETALDLAHPTPWGALWVYAFVLLLEWRLIGIRDAGRRALAGLLLAVVGVLFLGVGLGAWPIAVAATELTCPVGVSAEDLNALWGRAVAALGLVLVPLAGIALGLNRAEEPPLSAAPASVVAAAWLEPALPALGWLPTSGGTGAALAALLVGALFMLGLAGARGSRATLGGLPAYFALGIGGCIILGIQMDGPS